MSYAVMVKPMDEKTVAHFAKGFCKVHHDNISL